MNRKTFFIMVLGLACSASPLAGQWYDCNHCADIQACEGDGHANCGYGGMGQEWQGFCMGGCVGMSCGDLIDIVGEGPCDPSEEPTEELDGQPAVLDLNAPTSATSLVALAKATARGRATFERERGVVVLHSCSGDLLTGQVPLLGAARTHFEAILARSS